MQRLMAHEFYKEVAMQAAFYVLIMTIARVGIPLLSLLLLGVLVERSQAAKL